VDWLVKHLLLSDGAPESAAWWRAKLRDPTALVTASLQEALEWCRSSFGKDPNSWKWGATHAAQFAHPNPKVSSILFACAPTCAWKHL
jgi:acyl-homoserine lactone acylase PvdQ